MTAFSTAVRRRKAAEHALKRDPSPDTWERYQQAIRLVNDAFRRAA